ncbi:MAG: hypothetical protein KatS3mg035_1388 [Bacteroidia bacterium]|nr:MAG: hypothetical protein KatS3mg035_1388 [Bacteroidia bacterium]
MKNIVILIAGLFFVCHLQAQIVGETSIGVRGGFTGAPMGLTWHYVMTHHSSVEAHIGYSSKQGRALETGFSRGNILAGIVYQPYIIAGDRDVATCLYGSIGARARIHNYRFKEPPTIAYHKFKSKLTADFILGVGFLAELHETIEAFVQLDGVSFDSYAYGREFNVESTIGLRFRLN